MVEERGKRGGEAGLAGALVGCARLVAHGGGGGGEGQEREEMCVGIGREKR